MLIYKKYNEYALFNFCSKNYLDSNNYAFFDFKKNNKISRKINLFLLLNLFFLNCNNLFFLKQRALQFINFSFLYIMFFSIKSLRFCFKLINGAF